MIFRDVRSIRAGLPVAYWEVAAVVAITLVAFLLRVVNLSTLPAGFHGDEAVIGLEAQRILDEGYIGPYSPYAAGQPTGPMYLTAVSAWIFGNTVFAVRIVPALLGTLTVLALYVVLRRNVGAPAALLGSGILAVMSWHIHFSRIGFPLVAWPLLAVLTAGAVAEATRRSGPRWWAVAGVLTGAGIYVYNAHPLLAATIGLFIAGYLVLNRRVPLRRDLRDVAVFLLAMLIVLIPMVRFATDDDTYYWDHFERARTTDTEAWLALDSMSEQALFFAREYREVWIWLCCEPEVDRVDGTGLTIIAPHLMLLLAAFGLLLALWRGRGPLVLMGAMIVLIMPLGPVLTVGGDARRTLVTVPFIAMFCALALTGSVDALAKRSRRAATMAAVAGAMLVGTVAYQNINLYFREFADPAVQEQVLGKPMADAARFLKDLPADYYVYFYSNTWSIDYATRLYLAPDVRGEDRSDRFGEHHFEIEPGRGRPLFIFLGNYRNDIDTVRELYPGREITPDDFAVRPTFRAYEPEFDPASAPKLP